LLAAAKNINHGFVFYYCAKRKGEDNLQMNVWYIIYGLTKSLTGIQLASIAIPKKERKPCMK